MTEDAVRGAVERSLAKDTTNWTLSKVQRKYGSKLEEQERANVEGAVLADHGYRSAGHTGLVKGGRVVTFPRTGEPSESTDSGFVAKGANGSLVVHRDRIRITRHGARALIGQGFGAGEKEISIEHITAVQWRAAGRLTIGFIGFSFMGGTEARGGIADATRDENAVTFSGHDQPAFERAKTLIDARRRVPPQTAMASRPSEPRRRHRRGRT